MMNADSWLLGTYTLRKTKVRSYKCSEKTIFLSCKQELGELSQLTILRSRWMSLPHGHIRPSVHRSKWHWQQCPLEYQYGRIRRSLKQMTFPVLFHSCFFNLSSVLPCVHTYEGRLGTFLRCGWRRPFLWRKGHKDLKHQTFSCFQMPWTAALSLYDTAWQMA